MQFLMGLHESYAMIRGHILLMSPLPTTRKAYSLILQEERQRQIASNSTINNESMAMLSISSKKNGSGKQSSQNRFTTSNNSSSSSSRYNQKGPRHCTYCNGNNHIVETCFWLNGFPPGHKWHDKEPSRFEGANRSFQSRKSNHRQQSSSNNVQGSVDQTHHLQSIAPHLTLEQCTKIMDIVGKEEVSTLQANSAGLNSPFSVHTKLSDVWIIDSGATDHITHSPHHFSTSSHISLPPVGLPTGGKKHKSHH